ncbi:MAG: hypothetical protein QOD39_2596 [Mycobacterium sp.]|nr:hypothetical protein [Mycobacterium sp.]
MVMQLVASEPPRLHAVGGSNPSASAEDAMAVVV